MTHSIKNIGNQAELILYSQNIPEFKMPVSRGKTFQSTLMMSFSLTKMILKKRFIPLFRKFSNHPNRPL